MPSVVKTILQNNSVLWNWPLIVGVPPQSKLKPATLTRYHWGKELSRISPIIFRGVPLRYNIVLCNGAAEAVELYKKTLPGKIAIRTDVILIKCEPSFFQSPQPGPGLEMSARILANASGASGVIFFHTPVPDEKWFEDLVMELSHDLPLTKAFAQLKPGIFWAFVSPELDHHTRLSTLVSQISEGLMKGLYTLSKPVRYIRPTDSVVTIGSAVQLGRLMKEDFDKMDYSGESKTGTTMLGVTPGVKATRPIVMKPLQKNQVVITQRRFPLKGDTMHELFHKLHKPTTTGKPTTGSKPSTTGKPIILPGKKKFDFTSADTGGRGFAPVSKDKSSAKPPGKKSAKPPVKTGGIESLPVKKNKPAPPKGKKKGSSGTGITKTRQPRKWKDFPKKNGGSHHAPVKKNGGSTPQPETEVIKPRFLQVIINQPGSAKSITDYLLPETGYELNVFIGELVKKAIQSDKVFADEEVFTDPAITEAEILLELLTNISDKKQYSKLTLPRYGNSDTAGFLIQTPKGPAVFEATITAMYKGRAIQSFKIRSDIRTPKGKPVWKKIILKTEAVLVNNLENLGNRQPFAGNITLPADNAVSQKVSGVADGEPLDLLFDSAFAKMAEDIKTIIQELIISSTTTNQTEQEINDIMYALASQGSLFYEQYFKQFKAGNLPIQVISKRRDYIPIEFVYTLYPPGADAKICSKAKKALKKGACEQCCKNDDEWSKTICPFGFWGLSRVLERHSYKEEQKKTAKLDYAVSAASTDGRTVLKILQNTQFAESAKAGNGNPGLMKKVEEAIKNSSAEKATKAKDWTDWRAKITKTYPESLILIVHQETRRLVDNIEIGEDLLPVTQLQKEYLKAPGDNKTPFVVLIGCEVAKVEAAAFDAGNLLTGRGAAVVLSNFTKIRGKQAGEIVIKLVDLLKTLGKKEPSFGAIVLRLRQQLFSEGMIAALTLLSYGDADCKISTKA